MHTEWHICVKMFVGISEMTAFKTCGEKRELKSQYGNILADLQSASLLDAQRSTRGYPAIFNNNIQPCPERCLLMLPAIVGAIKDTTTCSRVCTDPHDIYCMSKRMCPQRRECSYYIEWRGQFPHIYGHTGMCSAGMRRGFCTLVLFNAYSSCISCFCDSVNKFRNKTGDMEREFKDTRV